MGAIPREFKSRPRRHFTFRPTSNITVLAVSYEKFPKICRRPTLQYKGVPPLHQTGGYSFFLECLNKDNKISIKVAKEPIAPEEIIIGRKSQHGGPEGHPGFCAY